MGQAPPRTGARMGEMPTAIPFHFIYKEVHTMTNDKETLKGYADLTDEEKRQTADEAVANHLDFITTDRTLCLVDGTAAACFINWSANPNRRDVK